MRIEIYIVTSEKPNQQDLENQKLALIKLFNGLTEIENLNGYWLNERQQLEQDKVNLWIIYIEKILIYTIKQSFKRFYRA